jgi:hypothetical protein
VVRVCDKDERNEGSSVKLRELSANLLGQLKPEEIELTVRTVNMATTSRPG